MRCAARRGGRSGRGAAACRALPVSLSPCAFRIVVRVGKEAKAAALGARGGRRRGLGGRGLEACQSAYLPGSDSVLACPASSVGAQLKRCPSDVGARRYPCSGCIAKGLSLISVHVRRYATLVAGALSRTCVQKNGGAQNNLARRCSIRAGQLAPVTLLILLSSAQRDSSRTPSSEEL